ncbi:hypothetical protein [Methylobacterium dankookense]|uniref:Uncharacterized protein n=1 Tax=Methylobacterium dankookense TaxID=560405 RepID=A0A564G5G7_9HYPH|nr:hypothetical protein [Methylobacterium dankookense]GJD56516.1 hypothetical protein IFDJLNFL_2413 [Methylobacterium dankookense]VUF15312.1 hypothetical protein MTDSW087_05050 [Methylobacterium dankookense]
MLDDSFTYGGLLIGLAALGLWLRLAIRALPTFETLLARYEHDPAPAEPWPFGPATRFAARLTALALVFSAIGYAIPD